KSENDRTRDLLATPSNGAASSNGSASAHEAKARSAHAKRGSSAGTTSKRPLDEDDDPFDEYVVSKAWDSSLFRRLLRFVKPYAHLFAGSFIGLGVLFVLDLIGPWIWKHAIDGPVTDAIRARDIQGAAADVSPYLHAF